MRYGADELMGASGGVTFDSGTSFTYFVPEAYTAVLSAVSHYCSSLLNVKLQLLYVIYLAASYTD